MVGVDVETEGALIVTNPDPAEMDRPIQPKLQPITGRSSSNDDILVNDSRDDTRVKHGWAVRENRQEVLIAYIQTKPGKI